MTTVNKRKSGVLLPVFSLPSGYGCGTFGKGAYRFIDKISQAGFSVWQLLPLCPTDSYHSPYMSCASFAGNTDFIDLDALIEEGLLKKEECEGAKETTPYSCEWDKLGKERRKLLRKAYERQGADEAEQYFKSDIRIKNAAEFLALKAQNGGKYFTEWSEKTVKKDEYLFELYLQYLFYTQWKKLKEYANSKGIEIWGDMPFYVSPDSSDVYNNKQSFLLEKDGTPSCVAGVPPDYFAKEGIDQYSEKALKWSRRTLSYKERE